MRVIYDFGANNGDDVGYYLKKADLVVAVEANPDLCSVMMRRFSSFVESGQLIIENCVLSVDHDTTDIEFYIHRRSHLLSQLPKPSDQQIADFTKVTLPARRPVDIIKQHGEPHYIKIDIEHYDHVVLRSLFDEGIVPPYLSVESHSARVLGLLLSRAEYAAFKLVDGASVSEDYASAEIQNKNGLVERYAFPLHSAGPFGGDLKGEWLNPEDFVRYLGIVGFGWKDIHVSRTDSPSPHASMRLRHVVVGSALNALRDPLRGRIRRLRGHVRRLLKH